jgi:hypothetical protein
VRVVGKKRVGGFSVKDQLHGEPWRGDSRLYFFRGSIACAQTRVQPHLLAEETPFIYESNLGLKLLMLVPYDVASNCNKNCRL